MVESSMMWDCTGVGDATLAPYDQDELAAMFRILMACDPADEGVHPGYLNDLAVTNPAGLTIRVASGAAMVDGTFYRNTANVDTVLVAPGLNTRYDRVVLRKSWAAKTVRVAITTGVEGAGVPLALVQNFGVTWEIALATVAITIVPVITITNERGFLPAGAPAYRRQGDSPTAWITGIGSLVNYRPGRSIIQCGAVQWTGAAHSHGSVLVTFPEAFAEAPIAFVSTQVTVPMATYAGTTPTQIECGWSDPAGVAITELNLQWIAIGPRA